MEHRWGIRRILEVGVTLYVESKSAAAGRLLSASSSGAYVATSAVLPIMSRVDVALGWGRTPHGVRNRVPAYVVRGDDRGIGIEWQEFAPLPVLALLNAPAPPARACSQASPAGIRTIAQARAADAYLTFGRPDSTLGSARNN